jgi:hypothetical protein
MPRFAVLSHDWPFPHFDLLLENEASLLAWRLSSWPPEPGCTFERLPDHRLHYLDYEGPVSNGRGRVLRVDAGQFEWIAPPPPIQVQLASDRFTGPLELPPAGSPPSSPQP